MLVLERCCDKLPFQCDKLPQMTVLSVTIALNPVTDCPQKKLFFTKLSLLIDSYLV